jgi:hypothetical protein
LEHLQNFWLWKVGPLIAYVSYGVSFLEGHTTCLYKYLNVHFWKVTWLADAVTKDCLLRKFNCGNYLPKKEISFLDNLTALMIGPVVKSLTVGTTFLKRKFDLTINILTI